MGAPQRTARRTGDSALAPGFELDVRLRCCGRICTGQMLMMDHRYLVEPPGAAAP